MVSGIEVEINGKLVERIFLDTAPKRMAWLFKDREHIHMRGDKGNEFYVTNWLLFPLYLEDSTEAVLLPEATTVIRLVASTKDWVYHLQDFIDALESASPNYVIRAVMLHRKWNEYGEQMEKLLSKERLTEILKIRRNFVSLKTYVGEIIAEREEKKKK